jgi:hypothetical protein
VPNTPNLHIDRQTAPTHDRTCPHAHEDMSSFRSCNGLFAVFRARIVSDAELTESVQTEVCLSQNAPLVLYRHTVIVR